MRCVALILLLKLTATLDVGATSPLNEVKNTENASCNCGCSNPGSAVKNQYPCVVALIDYRKYKGLPAPVAMPILCTATVISRRHAITLAVCVDGLSSGDVAVVTGDGLVYKVKAFDYMLTPSQTRYNSKHDIILVTTKRDMIYSELVMPVCLPFNFNPPMSGENVTVVDRLGNGYITAGHIDPIVQTTHAAVLSRGVCRMLKRGISSQQFCTFGSGNSTCRNTTYGPMLFTDPIDGDQYQIGISGPGQFCPGNLFGVHTRLTFFLPWIVNTTKADFCRKRPLEPILSAIVGKHTSEETRNRSIVFNSAHCLKDEIVLYTRLAAIFAFTILRMRFLN